MTTLQALELSMHRAQFKAKCASSDKVRRVHEDHLALLQIVVVDECRRLHRAGDAVPSSLSAATPN
jgi:hypothetical protein